MGSQGQQVHHTVPLGCGQRRPRYRQSIHVHIHILEINGRINFDCIMFIGMVRCGHTSRGSLKTPDENAIAVARIYVVSCIVNVRVVIA